MNATSETVLSAEPYGVPLVVEIDDPSLREAVRARLPARSVTPRPGADPARFGVSSSDGFHYEITRDRSPVGQAVELEIAIAMLELAIRSEVAQRAQDYLFIQAAAATVRGRALVLPGPAFSGKTRLVNELVGHGAELFSDEYVLLDGEGRLHSYVRPELPPTTIGLVASVPYVPGGVFSPRELGLAEGALILLSHAITLEHRPTATMEIVRRAMAGARAIESDRGDAAETAPALLALAADA